MATDDVLGKKRRALLDMEQNEAAAGASTDRLRELMDRAGPLIEQVNTLYRQFSSGGLEHPPNARRQLLDQIMASALLMAKPTRALRFQFNSLQARYVTYKERWDKLIRDIESGKVVRPSNHRPKHFKS